MSRKIHSKVVFNESWIGDEQFKTWLKREMIVIKQFVFYATTMLLTLQEWV